MRPQFQWSLGRRTLKLGERTLIMGVLNVTPDSFSDGGLFFSRESAIAQGLALLDAGADILDIGGESTRPGTPVAASGAAASEQAVSAREELDRVLPVIDALKRERPDAVLSIDTYKSSVAREALAAGVEIVNDVSGLLWDAEMATTIAQHACGAILMHTRGLPQEWSAMRHDPEIVSHVAEGLRQRAEVAIRFGIGHERIVLDPGFGFGKNQYENYALLAHFAELQSLGFPLLAAVSRKGFLARTLSKRLADSEISTEVRDTATVAASVAAALSGAHIIRVHNVRPAVEALAIADAILQHTSGATET